MTRVVIAAGFAVVISLPAQQVDDAGWRFENPAPAFSAGAGPRICIDEAHHNAHTIAGRFGPYTRLLRGDGFRVTPFAARITPAALTACDVLLTANPQSAPPGSDGFWTYPHASAFSRGEIDAVVSWVRGGGALLLFADHSPGAGASAGLASVLGLQVFDGWARINDQDDNPEIYARKDGRLAAHPILDGRTARERVDAVSVTIAGAFFPSESFQPLVTFGPASRGYVRLGEMGQGLAIAETDWPRFALHGWWLGATRLWDRGRIAVFGDVTACTAQLYGPAREPVGMNRPEARDNPQFCLNLVRWAAGAIPAQPRALPVIDMHLHAMAAAGNGPPPVAVCTSPIDLPAHDPARPWRDVFAERAKKPPCDDPVWSPVTDVDLMTETIAVMERRNIYGVLSGSIPRVTAWEQAAPGRFIRGFGFNVGDERVPDAGVMRGHFKDGRIAVLAEVTNQYAGIGSNEPRFERYLAAAEEFDIPVGIHVGTGPVGAPYLGWPSYRAALHSALTLEEPLLRHPKLRVYVMHAGWPMLDDMLAVMYAHPQVYVETGVIDWNLPRAEFHRYLQRLVDAGFGTRVMFGSDQMVWPGVIERAIDAIESAPFLTPDQKRDILYNNAARFLRLSDAEIARHHGR